MTERQGESEIDRDKETKTRQKERDKGRFIISSRENEREIETDTERQRRTDRRNKREREKNGGALKFVFFMLPKRLQFFSLTDILARESLVHPRHRNRMVQHAQTDKSVF